MASLLRMRYSSNSAGNKKVKRARIGFEKYWNTYGEPAIRIFKYGRSWMKNKKTEYKGYNRNKNKSNTTNIIKDWSNGN